ncbi:MAG: phosphoenolpyruvate carboxykinase (GTP) [Oscillospiraceae bacterium]|nr:phosphoenolpyruvate carboxykinase (GTP) [Oscillospiraceae bacterium]
MTTNPAILNWVSEIKALVKPEKEIWIDGTKEQAAELKRIATEAGILTPLNQEKLPGCTLHRTTVADAARSEQRTFICCEEKEEAGPSNNWKHSDEAYEELRELFKGVMEKRTMYVIPFCLGHPDSPLCRAGIKITDSIYVVLNTVILARCGKSAIDLLDNCGENWFRGLHSTGNRDPKGEDNRYICHFPKDNSVWAINTGYGVNAFLSKKSISLRLASRLAKAEGWLAEHMAIIEVEKPDGDVIYLAAAFPSGAGKTSLAMLDLPETYTKKGYKVRCISEDIAWLKKGTDGRLWAFNPESGVFGSLPGINAASNPNIIAMASKNTIYANTALNLDDNTVWWEGMNDEEITNAIDWRGNPWDNIRPEMPEIPVQADDEAYDEADENDDYLDDAIDDEDIDNNDEDDIGDDTQDDDNEDDDDEADDERSASSYLTVNTKRGAHSGSRFTAALEECACLSEKWNGAEGVPISAIIFGGRRSKAVPLVYQAFDWTHGVFVGSILGTESVTPAKPNSPVVRREPMAMLRYCGYNMGDYWKHWLKMGKRLGRNAPKIFNVNWFKMGPNGKPLWPGFGENIRVLDWIIRRVETKAGAVKPGIIESPVGYVPKAEDIDISGLEGLDFTVETIQSLLYVDKILWKEDVNGAKQLYAKFGERLPEELKEQLIDLEKRLMNA